MEDENNQSAGGVTDENLMPPAGGGPAGINLAPGVARVLVGRQIAAGDGGEEDAAFSVF